MVSRIMAKILGVTVKAATARLLDPLGQALLRVGFHRIRSPFWAPPAWSPGRSSSPPGRWIAATIVITSAP
jgi:hypothetical protein